MLTDRINFRAKFKDLTFFCMIAKTQTLEGITSLQSDNKHIPMWDLENCTLEQAKKTLTEIQSIYGLSNIFIVTDNNKTYRAWCFTKVDFDVYLHILIDCLPILDYNFVYYTVKRKKATLRTSSKKGRPKQRIVCVFQSFQCNTELDIAEKVVYDTGLEKRGISLLIGDN